MLSDSQRAQVDSLFDELLDTPAAQRLHALGRLPLIDPAVAAEVGSLLQALAASEGFLAGHAQAAGEPQTHSADIGSRLGDWRITRLIGAGGMGEVFEAERAVGDFEQRVAIKLLHAEPGGGIARFQAERQILARLDHPGIARLYDGGVTSDNRPYMVMEYVAGVSITEYCRERGVTLAQRLDLFVQTCDAVANAHRNLVIHRDLKPANILVTAEGQVKLLDFGIAKLMNETQQALTHGGATPLTPICAAPEQLAGQAVTTATDIYALGLLLFELLTGSHPWARPGMPMLHAMRIMLQERAPAPSTVAATQAEPPVPARLLRGDLDAIVAKALRAEPAHRYATVDALKTDIRHVLRGEAVAARDGARLYMFGRFLKRYRWIAAATAVVVASLSGGLGVALWQAQRAAVDRDIARRDAAREEAVRDELTRLFSAALADHENPAKSAKDMIDHSAERLLREYREQPQLAGSLVITLADLYRALEDVSGAGALLEGFLAQATPGTDAATLADAQQKLADIDLMAGRFDRASSLLDQSAAFWAKAPRQFAEERLEGLGIRARLQRRTGDLDAAIATGREAIRERSALSGHNHRETAILYNSLAIALTAANQLDAALAAYRETTKIYTALGLGDGLEAQIILANTGTLELRVGQLRPAEDLLKAAIERERALAGESAAVAAAMGNYGKVLSLTNRNALALPVLRQSIDLATKYTNPTSPVTIQNTLFLGDALIASGELAAARATLLPLQETSLAKYGVENLLTLRTRVAVVECAVALGQGDAARGALQSAIANLRQSGAAAVATLAQALLTLGDVELAARHPERAIVAYQEAIDLRSREAPAWDLEQARERLGEALDSQGDHAAAAALLKAALRGLQTDLGEDHPLARRGRAALARATDRERPRAAGG